MFYSTIGIRITLPVRKISCWKRFTLFLSLYWKSMVVVITPFALLPIILLNDIPVSIKMTMFIYTSMILQHLHTKYWCIWDYYKYFDIEKKCVIDWLLFLVKKSIQQSATYYNLTSSNLIYWLFVRFRLNSHKNCFMLMWLIERFIFLFFIFSISATSMHVCRSFNDNILVYWSSSITYVWHKYVFDYQLNAFPFTLI